MLSQVYDKSNLGQKRTKMNLSKYKEEQEMVIGCSGGRNRQGLPRCRGCAAYQQKNLGYAQLSERQLKRAFFMLPFPIRHQPFSLLMLSSL